MDASLVGWGCVCVCKGVSTEGSWTQQERAMHINCLELLAVDLAMRIFLKEHCGVSALLQLDNSTAVAYINNLGGTMSPALTSLAKLLWLWALERDIFLTAQHVPGVFNVIADLESRLQRDRSDWMLAHKVFQRINQAFDPLEVDLFVSRVTHQLPCFFSWKPDPLVEATDAFQQDRSRMKRLRQSSMVPNSTSPQPSLNSGSSGDIGGTSLEGSSLVPSSSRNVVRLSTAHSPTGFPSRERGSAESDRDSSSVSHLACLRERYRDSCLSAAASELILASWRMKSSQS